MKPQLIIKHFACFLMLISCAAYSQTLSIKVTGIRKPSGSLVLAFYTSQESFSVEKPLLVKVAPKTGIKNGEVHINYSDLKSGVYGIAIMDDENNNQVMDYGWFLPKEGFGFSNYYHTGFTRPAFSKFSFDLKNENKTVEIKLRYL